MCCFLSQHCDTLLSLPHSLVPKTSSTLSFLYRAWVAHGHTVFKGISYQCDCNDEQHVGSQLGGHLREVLMHHPSHHSKHEPVQLLSNVQYSFYTQFKCIIGLSLSLTTTVTGDYNSCRTVIDLMKSKRLYSILIISSTFDALQRLQVLASTNDFQAGRMS